ncbi:MAG: hypothetical protein AAF849_00455 [Bacteroidota bacterium]
MKTVLVLAIGFWIGRQIYINFDQEEARQKEAKLKEKLLQYFQKQGFSEKEANVKVQQFFA